VPNYCEALHFALHVPRTWDFATEVTAMLKEQDDGHVAEDGRVKLVQCKF